MADLTERSSSVFALAWNMFRNQLPEEIISEFDTFLKKSNIHRMNPSGGRGKKERGSYTICDGDYPVKFCNVELAPPAGFFASNYARCVVSSYVSLYFLPRVILFRFIHNETTAHRYAILWTTARWSKHTGNAGAHFYYSRYRVKVCAARDTVIGWMPEEDHGTSLPHCDPDADDPGFHQAGLAILTPVSLSNLWKKVRKGEISREEAEKEFVATNEE